MRTFRDYVDGLCFAEGHDLILPYEQHDRRVMFKLSHKVSDKCNKRFGETTTAFTSEIVDALIHRLCLDKKRNETQRVKRRAGKAANKATLDPGSALVSIIVTPSTSTHSH